MNRKTSKPSFPVWWYGLIFGGLMLFIVFLLWFFILKKKVPHPPPSPETKVLSVRIQAKSPTPIKKIHSMIAHDGKIEKKEVILSYDSLK